MIWLALFLITGFACLFSLLAIPQPALQVCIKVEGDPRVTLRTSDSPNNVSYDPYVSQENRCDHLLIPASKSR